MTSGETMPRRCQSQESNNAEGRAIRSPNRPVESCGKAMRMETGVMGREETQDGMCAEGIVGDGRKSEREPTTGY